MMPLEDREALMKELGVDKRTKHCPFCGNQRLWVGNLMASEQGVECLKCGATLGVEYGDRKIGKHHTLKELDAFLLRQAIRMWNKRYD